MANQFSAKLLFRAVAWRAFDPKSKMHVLVIDENNECRWSVSRRGVVLASGTCIHPSAARRRLRKFGADV